MIIVDQLLSQEVQIPLLLAQNQVFDKVWVATGDKSATDFILLVENRVLSEIKSNDVRT